MFKRRVIIFALMIFSLKMTIAQENSEVFQEGIQKIQSSIDHWNFREMLESRAYFERLLTKQKPTWLVNYYIAYCDYRLGIYLLQDDNKKDAKDYIIEGLNLLSKAVEEKPDFVDAYALMNSLIGNKISLMPISGMWNGPKAQKYITKAMQLEPENPRVFLIDGISKNFTPENFGGGKEAAGKSLLRAAELYKIDQPAPDMPSWGYDEVFAWLGIIDLSKGDKIAAMENFRKALKINPENSWVKEVLMKNIEE